VNRHRKALIVLVFVAPILLGSAVFASTLTWNRIGKGGLDGPYNYLQSSPEVTCLFKGKLYFGTGGGWSWGGQIWRYDGHEWVVVHKPKPGNPHISGVTTLAVLGDYLYAGMSLNNATCEVWRTDGTGKPPYRWTKISAAANVSQQYTYSVNSMAVVNGYLYCGTWNSFKGCQVWKYSGSSWTQVVGQGPAGSPTGPGFGNKENYAALSMTSSAGGELYVGTARYSGGEVWRLNKAGWAKLNKPGFGTSKNYYINVLIFFNNSLYAGTRNDDKGCQVWKYVGPSPSNWKAIGLNGMGDPNNKSVQSAAVFGNPGYLYFITENRESGGETENGESGCQVLRTNGKKWEKANTYGFGQGSVNAYGRTVSVFDGKLYAGLGSEFGARIYATSGGAKLPFAWSQVNDNGFSKNDNEEILSSAFYGGKLYIGTFNGLGCEVWRYEGNGWTQIASGGFGDPYNDRAMSMAVTNLGLHVGTRNGKTGTEIWRYNGSKWTQANKDGFGDASSAKAGAMFVNFGKLYVGTQSYDTKGKVWRCDGPGVSQWTKVNNNGFGVSHTVGVSCFAVFNNKLYAGTYDSNDPCRVWRYDGPGAGDWTAVSEDGFGVKSNHCVHQLAVYKGALYAGVWNAMMTGCEVWRYSGSGTGWSKVNASGFGTKDNNSPMSMVVFSNLLYVGTSNSASGGQIWAYDGSVWSKENKNGFGTSNNWSVNTLLNDGKNLYGGTANDETGCEVWTTGAGNSSPLVWRMSPFRVPGRARRR